MRNFRIDLKSRKANKNEIQANPKWKEEVGVGMTIFNKPGRYAYSVDFPRCFAFVVDVIFMLPF